MSIKQKFKNNPYLKYIVGTILFIIFILIDLQVGFLASRSVSLLIRVVYYGIMALGFNLLLGYAGQISLGHAAFMGFGAYLTAYISNNFGFGFVSTVLISGIIPMFIGVLLGLVALRLERLYLAIATLGLGVTIQFVFREWVGFTNGFSGVRLSRPEIFGFAFNNSRHYLLLISIVLLLVIIFTYNLVRSRTGRALAAMRDSNYAAQAMGVSLFKYKLIAFAVSAFYVGLAGSLYAYAERYVHPSTWGAELSLDMLAMVVIGGLASIGGSITGAAFLIFAPRLIQYVPFLRDIVNMNYIFTGLAMILVIKFMPVGIYNWFDYKILQPLLYNFSKDLKVKEDDLP
ncbi:MAG: branched-chain amino acid ABC transporter permease [Bacillota bacterium]